MTLLGAVAAAQGQAPGKHLQITPLYDEREVAAGKPFDIALVTKPEPGWHGYWGENPGDAGFPPRIEWTAPAGTVIGPWRWPVPSTLLVSGIMNYVYEAPFAPVVRVTLPRRKPDSGGWPLKLHLSYLVCTDRICVPEEQDVGLRPGMDDVLEFYTPPDLDHWRRALPRPLGSTATYAVDGQTLRIAVPYPAGAALEGGYLFASKPGQIDAAAPQRVTRDGDRLVIDTRGTPTGAIEGVLRVGAGQGLRLTATPGAVPGARGWLAAALLAFGGAVLGGLILNVMPCVFPILSLKALSLARTGGAAARREALGYTAGVVTVCVALGGAILLLRAGGSAVGWAFQLTDPRMIALLLALAVAIAANLSGLWEVPSLSFERGGAPAGAFATGALAAFVATPCTGPFMAAALGAALVLPWPAALCVFAGLGLGLALPFLLIGFVPALRRRLPRPGAWMERVRRVLAVPMWLTAAALVWLLWRQMGGPGVAVAVPAILALGLAWVGWRQRAGRSAVAALLVTLLLVAGPVALARPGAHLASNGDAAFSEARLAALRARGTPVFAYFTADWCLTCKVNERVAIDPARAALRSKGVAVLVGDWTDGDPALGRFIQAHERAGVPLYLYYPPGKEARVLPQLLTPGMLTTL